MTKETLQKLNRLHRGDLLLVTEMLNLKYPNAVARMHRDKEDVHHALRYIRKNRINMVKQYKEENNIP